MSKDADVTEPIGGPPSPRRSNPQNLLKVINSVLVSIGTLYLATNSVLVTAIGAVLVIAVAALYLLVHGGR